MGDGRYAAFRFRTYAGAGAVDGERRLLKINYDWDENPSFLIRDILDELVQVVPGVYLGKAFAEAWQIDAPELETGRLLRAAVRCVW